MAEQGYRSIVNVDWAPACIKRMQQRSSHAANQYIVADCRSMPQLASGSFDAAIDKGTLDGTLCAADGPVNAHKMLCEVHRVLRTDGTLVLISYGHPEARLPKLCAAGLAWNIELFVATHRREEECDDSGGVRVVNVVEYAGPYTAAHDLRALQMQDEVLYVYVCRKQSLLQAS